MNLRFFLPLTIVAVFMAMLPDRANAAKFNRVVDVGDQAYAWSALPGVDGKEHSLADYKKSKFLLVIFMANHCPVVKEYESRIKALAGKYSAKGVQIVGISVSTEKQDTLPHMQERAKASKFGFPWLADTSQVTGHKYGATATPQVFLLDSDRKIVYMGAIDSDFSGRNIEHHYLADALDAVLAGKEPEVTESRAIGCHIIYDDE